MTGLYVVTEAYRFLMVVAAMLVCLGHGSNDVANAITPLLVLFQTPDNPVDKKAFMIGSVGIAIGLLTLGHKVMETVGRKVIKLNFVRGFCAQYATAIAVIVGSMFGLPLSTTHCMVGSLFGIVLAERYDFVRLAYCGEDQMPEQSEMEISTFMTQEQEEEEEKKMETPLPTPRTARGTSSSSLNYSLMLTIVAWWLVTVPVAFIVAYLLEKVETAI